MWDTLVSEYQTLLIKIFILTQHLRKTNTVDENIHPDSIVRKILRARLEELSSFVLSIVRGLSSGEGPAVPSKGGTNTG